MRYKILIYSTIFILSVVLAYYANYAMVYRITAIVLSRVAIAFSLGYGLYLLFSDKAWLNLNKYLLLIWTGPLIYSLSKWLVIPVLLLIYGGEKISEWLKGEKNSSTLDLKTFRARLLFLMPDIIGVACTFFIVDIVREFTVWKKIVLNPVGLGAVGFFILLFLVLRYKEKADK
ncbi:MAG: hypothetical protein IPJ86_13670 [Bacteroidetes bacterium]|nr:hypothetical protein [Bacteroidota bacterium]